MTEHQLMVLTNRVLCPIPVSLDSHISEQLHFMHFVLFVTIGFFVFQQVLAAKMYELRAVAYQEAKILESKFFHLNSKSKKPRADERIKIVTWCDLRAGKTGVSEILNYGNEFATTAVTFA